MKKTAWAATFLLLALPAGAHAELGFGLGAAYPLQIAEQRGLDPQCILAGVNARWNPAWFLMDAGYALLLNGDGRYGFLDLGLCFDIRFLRLGLAGGLFHARWREPSWWESANGINIKANLDFMIGRLSVGLSGSFPLFADEMSLDPWLMTKQIGLNVFYWIGSRSRRR